MHQGFDSILVSLSFLTTVSMHHVGVVVLVDHYYLHFVVSRIPVEDGTGAVVVVEEVRSLGCSVVVLVGVALEGGGADHHPHGAVA